MSDVAYYNKSEMIQSTTFQICNKAATTGNLTWYSVLHLRL